MKTSVPLKQRHYKVTISDERSIEAKTSTFLTVSQLKIDVVAVVHVRHVLHQRDGVARVPLLAETQLQIEINQEAVASRPRQIDHVVKVVS